MINRRSCYQPNEILAVVRIGDQTIAVVKTHRLLKRFYAGPLQYGEIPDDVTDDQFFDYLDNAKAELQRIEGALRS